MDDEARDQANAALVLDEKIGERIRGEVGRMVYETGFSSALFGNDYFRVQLNNIIHQEIHRVLERELGRYLDMLHSKYR